MKFNELNKYYEDSKEVMYQLASQFRSLQDSLDCSKEEEMQIKEKIDIAVKNRNDNSSHLVRKKRHVKPEDELKSICLDLKNKKTKIATDFCQILNSIEKSLDTIETIDELDIVCKSSKNRVILNLTSVIQCIENKKIQRNQIYPKNELEDIKLIPIVESLVSQLTLTEKVQVKTKNACPQLMLNNDTSFILADLKKPKLSLESILSAGKLVFEYMMKFQQLCKDVQNDLTEANEMAMKLQDNLKGTNWEHIFNATENMNKHKNIWLSHGPVVQPIPELELSNHNNDIFEKDCLENNIPCFLLSTFGGMYQIQNENTIANKPTTVGKLEECNPVMSSTVMFGTRPSTTSSRIRIDEVPISPISPVGKSDSMLSDSIFFKDVELKNWKTMTSDEVNNLMTEHINKLDDDMEIELDEDENLTLLK